MNKPNEPKKYTWRTTNHWFQDLELIRDYCGLQSIRETIEHIIAHYKEIIK